MTTLTEIREGLADNLKAIPGVQASAYRLSNPTPPCAWVTIDDPLVEFDQTMQRGMDTWRLVIEVFVALTTDRGAQIKVDAYAASSGPESVKEAVEADRTLGGAVDDLRVTTIDGYGDYQLGDKGAVIGFRAHVEVIASGI